MHPSTLTGVLSRLEARGAIARDIDAEDRRRSRFRLTEMGERIDREKKGTVEAAVRRMLARVEGDAVAHTEAVLRMLAEELESVD
jgi:DNA-binding MarR family transcriptional regulator